MSMSKDRIDQVVSNDKEWRELILTKIDKIEDNQVNMLVTITTLKVKFGIIGSAFGFIGGAVVSVIAALIKH